MNFTIALSRLLAFFAFLGMSIAFGPPPFLSRDARRFLENFHQDFFNAATPRPSLFGQIEGQMRYRNDPIDVQAGFNFRPLHRVQDPLRPFFPQPPSLPNVFNNFRRFQQTLFTPSRGGERPESPGQVKSYEDDLKEIEKENENALNEITTDNFSVDFTESSSSTPVSYVNVGFTAGDSTLKYGYTI